MYSPELFPGLRFVPKDIVRGLPPTKVLLFRAGNVVICGAKNRGELLESWTALRGIMKPFACELDPTESDRTERKRTRRN